MQKKVENSPAPDPERAIYGFFLLIFSIICLIIFIIISHLPIEWLNIIGLTYLPQKYWYLAVPSYLVLLPFVVLGLYNSLNMRMVNKLNSINNLKDEHSVYNENLVDNLTESIPPISDIPLTKICEILYLDKQKFKDN